MLSIKCLRFGLWSTQRTLKDLFIYLLTYLLTYLVWGELVKPVQQHKTNGDTDDGFSCDLRFSSHPTFFQPLKN